jgi:hypothetical protein
MNEIRKEQEEQHREFLITLKKRSKEFEVVRNLFGLYHLS